VIPWGGLGGPHLVRAPQPMFDLDRANIEELLGSWHPFPRCTLVAREHQQHVQSGVDPGGGTVRAPGADRSLPHSSGLRKGPGEYRPTFLPRPSMTPRFRPTC
jgi:hypothetical protein